MARHQHSVRLEAERIAGNCNAGSADAREKSPAANPHAAKLATHFWACTGSLEERSSGLR